MVSLTASYCKLIRCVCCDTSPVARWVSCVLRKIVFLNLRYLQTQHTNLKIACMFYSVVVMNIKWIQNITSDGLLTSYKFHELQYISICFYRIPTQFLASTDTSLAPSTNYLLHSPPKMCVPKEHIMDPCINNNHKWLVERHRCSLTWSPE